MILRPKTFGKPIKKAAGLNDIENHRAVISAIAEPCQVLFPLLPEWMNKDYSYGDAKYNPFEVLCSCSEFSTKAAEYGLRDVRTICRHLFTFYTRRNLKEFCPMEFLLLASARKIGAETFYRPEGASGGLIFGRKTDSEWVNVYTGAPRYIRFGYNLILEKWSDRMAPENSKEILLLLKNCFSVSRDNV